MSAVGTTLLQNPGWNEGKALIPPWVNKDKKIGAP